MKLQAILPSNLSIAAINGNRVCVVAGDKTIAGCIATGRRKNIPDRLLANKPCFSLCVMDDIVRPFGDVVRSLKLNPSGDNCVNFIYRQMDERGRSDQPCILGAALA